MLFQSQCLSLAVVAGVAIAPALAFLPTFISHSSPPSLASVQSQHASSTSLHMGRAIKRGGLKDISPGTVAKKSSKKKKKGKKGGSSSSSSSTSSASAGAASSGVGVSSKLSEWASDAGEEVPAASAAVVETVEEKTSKKEGGDKSKGRKTRQAERRSEEVERQRLVENTVDDLLDIFDPLDEEGQSKKQRKVEFDMPTVLNKIHLLIDNPNPSTGLKGLTAGQKLRDYRMVWAGSDDAICHVGTGLHNVPLARLEEVFLTLGKKRIEVKEVIRILGPFPNVRNTLKGDVALPKSSSTASKMKIEYDSMIDGTGKQILAGSETNKRALELDVLFADENAIVCAVPSEEGGVGDQGSKVLFFAAEESLNVKLEMLRVA
mmetsp:Transcript_10870/g.18092  ORF Transcript_10870/g.18092 Transcript_10870/m.18092 type:complete len:377 (-) Transcript_10870:40-1170(-)